MQHRAIETKQRILEVATTVFASKGLNGAKIDEIATTGGVNKQRIYAYYGSKAGLFEAVLKQAFEEVELFSRHTIESATEHPERLTEILLKGFLEVHATHPHFWRLLSWANLEGAACASSLDQARQRENEALRQIFDQAIVTGILRKIRFETYLFTLLAASYFYYSNRLTLAHTLDVHLGSGEWSERLCDELNRIFTP